MIEVESAHKFWGDVTSFAFIFSSEERTSGGPGGQGVVLAKAEIRSQIQLG